MEYEKCDEVKERMSDGEKDRLVEIDATNDEVMKENVSETGIGLVHNDWNRNVANWRFNEYTEDGNQLCSTHFGAFDFQLLQEL